MSAPPRFKLYQYEYCSDCIPIRLLLQHSGVPHELVTLPPGDPTQIVERTGGKYYMTPMVEDMLSNEPIYQEGEEDQRVARYIASVARLDLFPRDLSGMQEIITNYVEKVVAPVATKICFSHTETWLKTNVERGLVRRHNERKYGEGCMEQWLLKFPDLVNEFFLKLRPLVRILVGSPFLLAATPTYADYVLAGAIGTYLFNSATSIPGEWVILSAWYDRIKVGKFDDKWSAESITAQSISDDAGAGEASPDMKDLEAAVAELKLRPGRKALDVGSGVGHSGLFLASQGLDVTLCDSSQQMIDQVVLRAAERELKVSIQCHPAEKMPYNDGTFDLILAHDAAHYFGEPEQFMKEVGRLLKMYGYVVIVDQAGLEDHHEASAWLDEVERMRHPGHIRYVKPSEWKRWAEANGLKVTRNEIKPFKMDNLNRYLSEANMSVDSRQKVLEHVARAPTSAREVYKVGQADGVISWTSRRLVFVAGKI